MAPFQQQNFPRLAITFGTYCVGFSSVVPLFLCYLLHNMIGKNYQFLIIGRPASLYIRISCCRTIFIFHPLGLYAWIALYTFSARISLCLLVKINVYFSIYSFFIPIEIRKIVGTYYLYNSIEIEIYFITYQFYILVPI